jgi:hypothetical protein
MELKILADYIQTYFQLAYVNTAMFKNAYIQTLHKFVNIFICMYVYKCTHIYVYIYMYINTEIFIYIYIYVYKYINIYIHILYEYYTHVIYTI